MTDTRRRFVLKLAFGPVVVALAAAAGLLRSSRAPAAEWSKDAFSAATMEDALRILHGTHATVPSGAIKIQAPFLVENSAAVAVAVSTSLPDVQSISILVARNKQPLAAHVNFSGALPYFATNIKMSFNSDVHFVVKSGDKLHSAKQLIKIAAGRG